jgi:hypothetical protein
MTSSGIRPAEMVICRAQTVATSFTSDKEAWGPSGGIELAQTSCCPLLLSPLASPQGR